MNVFSTIGNVGREPELKYVGQNNTPLLQFSIAVKKGIGQNAKEFWLGCSIFGKRATALQPYIHKGDRIGVTGEIALETFQGNQGQRTVLVCDVRDVTLLGGGNGQQGNRQPQGGYQGSQPVYNNQQPQGNSQNSAPQGGQQGYSGGPQMPPEDPSFAGGEQPLDDSIPF